MAFVAKSRLGYSAHPERNARAYERARRAQSWTPDNDIPWGMASSLPPEQLELAWQLSSQSTYAEEAGLITAARLLLMLDDRSARLCLATQVSDEAKHSYAFSTYAVRSRGRLASVRPSSQELLDSLNGVDDPLALFVVHTLLEGLALDEFAILQPIFEGDPLGVIYGHVRTDEARHVGMGLDYLAVALREEVSDEIHQVIRWCEASTLQFAQLGPSSISGLARVSGKSSSDVERLLVGRLRRRTEQISGFIRNSERSDVP